jgi:hypothetical protein
MVADAGRGVAGAVKVAVDTCVGKKGIKILLAAGHAVVVVAEAAEADRVWFARALERGATHVIAADNDLEILCYDHSIKFFRARQKHSGALTARRFLLRYPS